MPIAIQAELSGFDRGVWGLEGNLVVRSVAERPIRGRSAATEGKRRFAGEIVFVPVSVLHFNHAVRIVNAQWTVLAHCNCDLCHATSGGMNSFQIIVQQ